MNISKTILTVTASALCALAPIAALAGPFEDAHKAYSNGNYASAFSQFSPLAAAGNDDAQYYIAKLYQFGNGVLQDYDQAYYWFSKSANNGDPDSMYEMGGLYDKGNGVAQNKSTAFMWYQKAVDAGHKGANYDLAYAYEKGEGTGQSYSQAAKYYRQSADYGFYDAAIRLAVLYEGGKGVPQNYADAARLYNNVINAEKVDDKYKAKAMAYLGELTETGKGVPQDRNKALSLYRQASAIGNDYAARQLIRLGADNSAPTAPAAPDTAVSIEWEEEISTCLEMDENPEGIPNQMVYATCKSAHYTALMGAQDTSNSAKKREGYWLIAAKAGDVAIRHLALSDRDEVGTPQFCKIIGTSLMAYRRVTIPDLKALLDTEILESGDELCDLMSGGGQ